MKLAFPKLDGLKTMIPAKAGSIKIGGRIHYVWNLQQLDSLPKGGNVVLAGELAGVSLKSDASVAFPGYIAQPDLILPSGQRLKAWIHPRVAAIRTLLRRATLMADQMAEYVVGQKRDTLLVSCVFQQDETTLLIAISEKGKLVAADERRLPPQTDARFHVDFEDHLDKLSFRYPDAHLLVCDPIDPGWVSPKWEHADDRPFRSRRVRALGGQAGRFNPVPYLLPIVLIAGVLAGGAYMLLPHHDEYVRQLSDFQREARVVTGGNEYAAAEVDLLQRRKQFIEAARASSARIAGAMEYAVAVANVVPAGARVLEMTVKVKDPKGARTGYEAAADVSAVVMVELDEKMSALDQANPILSKIAAATKMRGRLASNGWREEKTTEQGKARSWRIYTIEAVRVEEGAK